MNRCLNCLSENLISIVDKNRVYYKCKNCGSSNARILDSNRQIFSKKINGLTVHITVAALVKKGDKYLLLNRTNFPFGFALPMGHLEYNETINGSIARELFEGTGLVINHKKLIFHETFNDSCKNGGDLHEWYLYECQCIGDIKLNNEASEHIWATKAKIESLDLVGPTRYALSKAKIIEQIKDEEDFKKMPIRTRKSNDSQKRAKIEQSALEGLPMPLLIFDERNKMYYSNSNATKLLLTLRKDEENYANLQQMFESLSFRAIDSQGDLSANFHFNKEKVLNIIASPLLMDEKVCGATITFKDVTDQKMHEARDLLAHKSSLALSSNSSSSEIIKTLLKQTLEFLNITGCSLMLLERDILKVLMRYSIYDQKKRKPLELKIGEGVAGWVAEKRTPLAIPNTGDDPSFIGSAKIQEKSLLSVPVLSGKDVLGVLNVSKKRGLFFSEDEMKIITTVANRIAIALVNQKLYQALYNDKKTLETVLGTSTDGLILIDKDLKLIFANTASRKINGLTEDEIKNHHLQNFLKKTSPKNTKKFLSLVERAITKKKRITTNFVSEKGPTKVVRTIFNPIIEKKGFCDSVLIGFNDITKIRLREKMIQNQISQITALFKISAISIENNQSFYSQILEKTAEISGSKTADMVLIGKEKTFRNCSGAKCLEVIKRNDSREKGIIVNDFRTSNPTKCESNISKLLAVPIVVQKKGIGYLIVTNKKSNYNSHDLRLLGIIAGRVSRKIETDNYIKELKSDQQKISEIINNTGDGIVVRDFNGEIVIWNTALSEIMGYENIHLYEKHNPGVETRFEEIKRNAYRNHYKALHRRLKIKNSDGQDLWLQITDSFIHSNGKLEYVISLIRDITRQEELESQQKEFIYTATHELRTPITAIRGYLSMILNGDAGPVNPKQALYFKRASQSTDKLVSLVEDLLKVARIEENKMLVEDKPYSAQKLVKEVVSDFKPKASAKKIVLDAKISNDFRLQGDYEKTRQALSNLVDNAIKYTKKGNVGIVAEKNSKNGLANIEVIDSGLGITRKEQSFIFNKFYRVFNSETIKAGGTGLGLFIVKNLVEKQGGKIEVESKVGKGSKFTLSLPLEKD